MTRAELGHTSGLGLTPIKGGGNMTNHINYRRAWAELKLYVMELRSGSKQISVDHDPSKANVTKVAAAEILKKMERLERKHTRALE